MDRRGGPALSSFTAPHAPFPHPAEVRRDNGGAVRRLEMKRFAHALIAAMALVLTGGSVVAATLDTVKQRGVLNCGANGQLPGFGLPDAQGNWTGLDVDLCRAIAAAIFNDANKVKFVPLTAPNRFTALQTGDVDVLVRNTTWTLSRDTQLGLNPTGINYYDFQGFMVRKALKV